MRILKASNNITDDIKNIVGEMYNIESSTYTYENGKKVNDPIDGYPQITIENINRVIHAAEGYIFVSPDIKLDLIESMIINTLYEPICMELEFPPKHLKTYRTIRMDYHTNIKIRPIFDITVANQAHPNNVKRQLARISDLCENRKATFTWFIIHINEFNFSINNTNIESAVSRFICSILYDSDNICTLDHNAITMNYNQQLLRGWSMISHQSMRLTSYGCPVMFELNSQWRNNDETYINNLRSIPRAKIYENKYGVIKLKPIKNKSDNKKETETETDLCYKCLTPLYGDNYILYGWIKNPDSEFGKAICPFCLHNDVSRVPIEMKYFRIFRVTFPKTVEDMIEKDDNKIRREIMYEAIKSLRKCQFINKNGSGVNYIEIGDNWLGFKNINEYLYCTFSNTNTKPVCLLKSIDLIK